MLLPQAFATGKLDLRENAMVFEIALDTEGRARSVRYFDEAAATHEVFARQIVVSGNSIGSAHMLLNSSSARFPQGLANSSGLVGKNLTFHHLPMVRYRIEEPAFGMTGLNTTAVVDDLHGSDSQRGFIRGGVFGRVAQRHHRIRQRRDELPRDREEVGAGLQGLSADLPHTVGMIGFLEDLPWR